MRPVKRNSIQAPVSNDTLNGHARNISPTPKIHRVRRNPETGDKYECKQCHKRFSRPSALTGHLLIHSGDRPYACKECSKRFNVESNLRRHIKIHIKNHHHQRKTHQAPPQNPPLPNALNSYTEPYTDPYTDPYTMLAPTWKLTPQEFFAGHELPFAGHPPQFQPGLVPPFVPAQPIVSYPLEASPYVEPREAFISERPREAGDFEGGDGGGMHFAARGWRERGVWSGDVGGA